MFTLFRPVFKKTFFTKKWLSMPILSTVLAVTSLSISSCVNTDTKTSTASAIPSTENELISFEQMTSDITYLASDSLRGRGNFSAEINHAAEFIAGRFAESGLIGTANITSATSANDFLQKYQINSITPSTLKVSLNGQTVSSQNSTMMINVEQLSWQLDASNFTPEKTAQIKTHQIGKDDDVRALLGAINKQGGQHLVLLHPAHQAMFSRYQAYFSKGITKLAQPLTKDTVNKERIHAATSTDKQPVHAMVMVLTKVNVAELTSATVAATTTTKTTTLSNVVAMLPGTTMADEIVLFSAHYDHLGVNSSAQTSDVIYNGADDDASGTAAVINLAQHFAKQGNNKRTLLFAAFSAEEIGGFGSRYFAKQVNPDTITAMINIEMIGKPSKFGHGTLWMTGMKRSSLGEQLNTTLKTSGMEIYQDPYPAQRLFYRSDNATLARLGVPAHSFSSTQLDKDQHYHQVSDDLASLNLPSMHQAINTLAIATQPLVTGKITPTRVDVNLVEQRGLIY